MKKIAISLCAIALVMGTVSCKKEIIDPIVEDNPVPVYAEGIYHPTLKIATVGEDGELTQQWNWVGDNLDQIIATNGENVTYNYSGNYIAKVSTAGDRAEEIRYYYDGNHAFQSCEIYYDGVKALTMVFTHNAAGKISSADVTIEDSFLLSLAGDLLGFDSSFEKLVGRPAAESMITMAKIAHAKGTKFSVGDKSVTANIDWAGENVSNLVLQARMTLNLDTNDLNLVQQFLPIPDEYLPIIQMAMVYGGGLPLTLALDDTISSTFDDNYNPMFCNWGMMVSPETLSLNNILTQTSKGAVSVKISFMGQSMDLFNNPMDDYTEYQYQYNDKKYPTHVSGDAELEYTYKQ
jgi:hypothetical protein